MSHELLLVCDSCGHRLSVANQRVLPKGWIAHRARGGKLRHYCAPFEFERRKDPPRREPLRPIGEALTPAFIRDLPVIDNNRFPVTTPAPTDGQNQPLIFQWPEREGRNPDAS